VEEVWVTAAVRTPIGKRGRALAEVHPAELLGDLIRAALTGIELPAESVDQALVGCVTQVGDQAYNIGRMAWLAAGLTADVPATTLDAQCGSSQQAANAAAALIASGNADHVVVGGVELMSRHPLGSNVEGGLGEPMGRAYRDRYEVINQGESAERIADRWGIERAECDEIALRSQERAAEAWRMGRFHAEVHPVDLAAADGTEQVRLSQDETFRPTTREALAALKPRFRPNGRHTAGNSSQISDGAACLVLSSASAARLLGLRPLAELTHQATVGVDPVIKLTGPIPATRRLLQRAGLHADGVDLFEVNEAFASVVAAWTREIDVPDKKVNVNGGAIALGHPVGATGARLLTTMVHELGRRGGGCGVVTMCCGGGLGTATMLIARDGDLSTRDS
jgi:acetyl-CoA acetyltransferase family protein